MLEMLHCYICYKIEAGSAISVFLIIRVFVFIVYDFPIFKFGKILFKRGIHIKNKHAPMKPQTS